jgi:hypothetical protein
MGTVQNFPHPVIEWDENGNPTIAYGDTSAERFKQVQERAMVNLEGSILATGNLSLKVLRNHPQGDIEP